MPNRKYNSRLLDFQTALYTVPVSTTGATGLLQKKNLADSLKNVLDAATYAAVFNALPEQFAPVALRWRCSPEIGLPVSPFKVYKRPKSIAYPTIAVLPVADSSGRQMMLGPFWQLSFQLVNTGAAGPVTIAPLDENHDPYPGIQQTFNLSANGTVAVKMRFPNIYGILVTSGSAALQSITGVRTEDFLNDGNWVLTENVGLPFKAAGPTAVAYQNLQQGHPLAPVTGYQAAINRLGVAQLFYKAPSLQQPDGVTLPTWPVPPPGVLVDSYHYVQKTVNGTSTGILYDIQEMLTRVFTSKQLYDGRQAVYTKDIKVAGFTDDGSQSSEGGTLQNPVCSTTLMAAATDCWSALGLGFGTTDFSLLGMDASPDCDYMVSATFQQPLYDILVTNRGVLRKIKGFEPVEIAAAAHMAQPLGPVSGLGNEIHSENRPLKTDARFSDDVKLYWDAPGRNVPQGYAVAVKDAFSSGPVYLNAQRPLLSGIKKPHLPTARADADADDIAGPDAATVNRFFHHRSERSDTGPASKYYYVAAHDVFGRWSAFAKTASTLPAAPQVTADIISGQFLLDLPDDPALHKYNATLELTVAWHWDDRQPFEISIGGHFQSISALSGKSKNLPLPTPPGIELDSTSGAVKIDLAIAFEGTGPYVKKLTPQPVTAKPTEATVTLDTAQSNMPHLGVYKVRIKGFQLDFNPEGKMAYVAYLRSRQLVTPGIQTPAGKPKLLYAMDPRPRTAPVLPPDIQWGSLPDAQNVSRFRVGFATVPGAAGYAIYRATEASLRDKGGLLPPSATDDLTTRRDQLMSLAGNPAVKDAFIRLNTEMLKTPEADIELPGDLNGLYIYAVTTFTAQRVESDFGASRLYVGVPRRYTPPAPVLSVFTKKAAGAKNMREVTLKIELPQGTRTERVEVFKTAKSGLASSLDLMGQAVSATSTIQPDDGWKAYDAAGAELKNAQPGAVAVLKKTELVPAGWQPLYYRAAGFGAKQEAAGKLPGRSGSSNLAEVLVAPPDSAPSLLNATLMSAGGGLLRLEAFTNGSIRPTPYGSFRLRVEKRDPSTNGYLEVVTRELPLIPAKKSGEQPALKTLWRLGKDAAGNYEYEFYVEAEAVAEYRITVTDPLGRSSSAVVLHNQPPATFRNLQLKPLLLSNELSFELNIGNKLPEAGHYLLEILTQKRAAAPATVYTGNLDAIGNAIVPSANPVVYVSGTSADGFYKYNAAFKGFAYGGAFNGAIVLLRITDPDGKVSTYNSSGRATS